MAASERHEGYACDPEPVAEALRADGLPVSDAWRAFVQRFGGLHLTYPHHCEPETTDGAHFDAAFAAGGVFPGWLAERQQRAGEHLAPVGEAFHNHMIVLVGESGAGREVTAEMSRFTFFEVVRAVDNQTTRELGVAEQEGIVLGIADDEPPGVWYAVLFDDEAYDLAEDDLVTTGRSVPRESIYDGTSIRVDPEGNLLGGDG